MKEEIKEEIKKEIFISHISDEAALAIGLKELLEKAFPNQCKAFVSSDISDLSGGVQWMKELEEKLRSTELLIVICSPRSLTRQWISIESGFAWARRKPIIPICHAGLTKDNLPSPFNAFQGLELNLNSTAFISDLFKSIKNNLFKNDESGSFTRKSYSLEELEEATEKLQKAIPKLPYYDFFISSPMSAFDDDESYQEFRETIILPVISQLCSQREDCKVYCVAKDKTSLSDLDLEHESAKEDIKALTNSKSFIFIYPKRVASSCLIEVGYALALKIPSVYLTPQDVALPYMLVKAAEVYDHVRSYQYIGASNLLSKIGKIYKKSK